jgi:hypothetical protein
VLGGQPQPLPAGDERLDRRPNAGHFIDERRGRRQMLDVVQDEEQAAIPNGRADGFEERTVAGLSHVEGLRDLRQDEFERGEGSQRDDPYAAGEDVRRDFADAECQAGLADAAGTGQREQPDLRTAQQVHHLRDALLPPD